MAEENIKKVKTIKGWSVNHPFSFGNMFFAFLTLCLVGLPLVIVFIPLVSVYIPGEGEGAAATLMPYIRGADLFQGLFEDFFQNPRENLLVFAQAGGEDMMKFARAFYIVMALLIALIILLGVFSFVFFMINIIKGYNRNARLVRLVCILDFMITFAIAVLFLVMYLFITLTGGENVFFVWWSFVLTGSVLVLLITTNITYTNVYKDVIYEHELEYHSDGENETVTQVASVHNVVKVDYKPANVLPPNLSSIGGHAFAENQFLEIANIPVGISSLGAGAFANCLRLKVVALPNSVKEIGFNCFFNCASLERINFAGTKEQWRHIKRGSNWLAKAKTTRVVCIDGPIVVNPYH